MIPDGIIQITFVIEKHTWHEEANQENREEDESPITKSTTHD